MQIKQTGQPIPVSKVESDQREEVSKIKPIGSQQIPDSFETGKASSAENQSNTSSAEPEKKAGQITGGILIKQMTQARLAESGIRVPTSSKETKGKKDLNETEKDQAEITDPKVDLNRRDLALDTTTPQGATLPEGAYSGDPRSNVGKKTQALRDFMTEHNIDVGSGSGTGTTATSTGSGIDASHSRVGAGVSSDDLNNAIGGGPTGPGDPMDSVNEKFAGLNNARNLSSIENIGAELQNAAGSADDTHRSFGKDMIAQDGGAGYGNVIHYDDEGIKGGSSTAAKDNPGLNKAVNQTYINGGHGSEREWGLMAGKDGVNPNDYKTDDGYRVQTGRDGTKVITSPDGTKTVVKPDGSSTSVSPDGSTKTTDTKGKTETTPPLEDPKKGTPTASSTTSDDYVDPEVEQMHEVINGTLEKLGLGDMTHIPRSPHAPKNSPDSGPEPVGVSKDDMQPGLISQFGEYGLVGQPNQDSEVHDGDNANFHGLPGDTVTDPQDGNPYHGNTRNDDVNTSPQTGMEENADDDNDEEKKSKIKMDFKPPTNLPYNKL